ncbi:OLC1v1004732C1 [Oldenlandia corymbosa var. corymbosa]|uniref:OLC1v1004732C1 n=1 Tax=Oldenlandia corymbosa var. corymbosa TaxID=529605 RepID=A0AAV1DFN8_OLDCO|nr:OLC1v1004732C1 [Oldenlandia corymbosa var. corymbosa]
MSAKDCGHHEHERKKLFRRLIIAAAALIVAVLFIILLVYLILRPAKPQFILQDATIYSFNVSQPPSPPPAFLTSTFQITLSSRNPNDKIGVYYDRVDVYAAYRGQQITLPTLLPPTYQGHKDVAVWSPFLFGENVPIAPFYSDALTQDQFAGTVMINIRVNGRIRWKVGTFISGRYRLFVNCPAYINIGKWKSGNIVIGPAPPAMKFQLVQNCHVDV